MNGPAKIQLRLPLSQREDLQEGGEELLEDVRGGVLPEGVIMTPGRGVLQRSNSAPGRLQGHYYPTPHNSPSPSPSSSSSGDIGNIAGNLDSVLDRYVRIR